MSGPSGWSAKHDRFGTIYRTVYLQQYSQRRTNSRYIKVNKVLQRVLPRRSQWNVLFNTSIYTRWQLCNVLPIVQSVGRATRSPTVTWSLCRFQRHIRSVLPAEKRWSHDHDVQVNGCNDAWLQGSTSCLVEPRTISSFPTSPHQFGCFMVMTDVNLQETSPMTATIFVVSTSCRSVYTQHITEKLKHCWAITRPGCYALATDKSTVNLIPA